jgi:DNA-binding MarR family transcriptional regulator
MDDHGTATVAVEINTLAKVLNSLVKRDLERRLQSHGVNLGTLPYGALRLLGCESATISELSRKMHMSAATLVPVVDGLEREGLARRGQDPRDRRRVPLSITERGAEVLARVPFVDPDDSLVSSLNRMGEGQSQQLLMLMRKLIAAMSDDGERVVEEISAAACSLGS